MTIVIWMVPVARETPVARVILAVLTALVVRVVPTAVMVRAVLLDLQVVAP